MKTMDSTTPTAEKMEFTTITLVDDKVVYMVLKEAEVQAIIDKVQSESKTGGEI